MKSSRIPGAETRWQEYRNVVTNYIMEDIQAGDTVIIIGAGACDDIAVELLLEHGAEVWLADMDTEAMNAVTMRLTDRLKNRMKCLHCIETDLMQLPVQERFHYGEACSDGIAALQTWWKRREQQWKQGVNICADICNTMQEQKLASFDHVICLGVNSQLCIPLVLPLEERKMAEDREYWQQAVRWIQEENERLAQAFLIETRKIARRTVLGLEYTTIYQTQAYREQQICHTLEKQGSAGLHALQLPRVEGAYQVEQELGRQCQKGLFQIIDHQYMLWPFSEEKTYLMVIFKLLAI